MYVYIWTVDTQQGRSRHRCGISQQLAVARRRSRHTACLCLCAARHRQRHRHRHTHTHRARQHTQSDHRPRTTEPSTSATHVPGKKQNMQHLVIQDEKPTITHTHAHTHTHIQTHTHTLNTCWFVFCCLSSRPRNTCANRGIHAGLPTFAPGRPVEKHKQSCGVGSRAATLHPVTWDAE